MEENINKLALTEDVSTENVIAIESIEAKLRWKVENVSNLTAREFSPFYRVHNLSFKISAEVLNNDDESGKHLAIFLFCENDSNENFWRCNVTTEFKLLSKNGSPPFSIKISHVFSKDSDRLGIRNFYPWHQLIDLEKGWIKDDSFTFEVLLTADVIEDMPKDCE